MMRRDRRTDGPFRWTKTYYVSLILRYGPSGCRSLQIFCIFTLVRQPHFFLFLVYRQISMVHLTCIIRTNMI